MKFQTSPRAFTSSDANRIVQLARAYAFAGPDLIVEYGVRQSAEGIVTADSRSWHEDSDLYDGPLSIHDLRETITAGFTIDLYLFDDEAGLIGNADAVWDGGQWRVFDPFAARSQQPGGRA